MTTIEKLDRLFEIIGELTTFYGKLANELPKLEFASAHPPAYSELKKMRRIRC